MRSIARRPAAAEPRLEVEEGAAAAVVSRKIRVMGFLTLNYHPPPHPPLPLLLLASYTVVPRQGMHPHPWHLLRTSSVGRTPPVDGTR